MSGGEATESRATLRLCIEGKRHNLSHTILTVSINKRTTSTCHLKSLQPSKCTSLNSKIKSGEIGPMLGMFHF